MTCCVARKTYFKLEYYKLQTEDELEFFGSMWSTSFWVSGQMVPDKYFKIRYRKTHSATSSLPLILT